MQGFDRHMNPEGGRRRQVRIHKSAKDYDRSKEQKTEDELIEDEEE